ncbi:MAG: hypothetical protein ACYDCH_15650 [Gaiellaceae bacterium]
MAPRSLAALVLACLLAALATGCGVRNSKPYTARGSAPCFRTLGFTGVSTDPLKVGFIAGVAENGGLIGKAKDGNTLTIAFAADAPGAAATAAAFKRNAPKSLQSHISDILETQRNAVLVWTTSPTAAQLGAAMGCLKP